MLNSPEYHRSKAEIMKPLDAFFVKLENRTQGAVDEANVRAPFYWMLIIVAMSMLTLMLAIVGCITFKRIIGGMEKLRLSMGEVADGHLENRIGLAENDDEIGDMGKALEIFREGAIGKRRLEQEALENRERAETERIAMQQKAEAEAAERLRIATSGLAAGLNRLASGDLAFQINDVFAQDFEALRHDFNRSVVQLGTTLGEISSSISTLDTGTREIASGTDDLSGRSEQQAASLEETAAALDEITVNVTNSSRRTLVNEALRLRDLVSQFRLEGASMADSMRIGDTSHSSNARALNRKVAAAFNGNSALDMQDDWEEFWGIRDLDLMGWAVILTVQSSDNEL